MRNLLRIFALTRSEQQVVILILVTLVTIAILKRHYDESKTSGVRPGPAPTPTLSAINRGSESAGEGDHR